MTETIETAGDLLREQFANLTSDAGRKALAKRKITLFLILATLLVTAAYVPILRGGGEMKMLPVALLMWMPGLAAILTQLITTRSIKGLGWKPRTGKLLGLALVLPLIYALPVYGLTWLSGLGSFNPAGWSAEAGGLAALPALGLLLTAGMVQSLLTALGEEIGWRGLLVPQLARLTSLRNVWLISSVVWLLFHVPLILGGDYHAEGTPLWFSLLCFTAMVFAMSAVMAWIRLASGSLWTAALLHASHNLIVQGIFDAGTKAGPVSPYVTGEFGAGLAVTIGMVGWVLWRRGVGQNNLNG